MTVRGGGVPHQPWLQMPVLRMGPPPRSYAADAQQCIMGSGSLDPHRIQGCGTILSCAIRGLPSYRHPDHSKRASVLGAVKDEALRVALRAILDRSCARRREHLCGRGEGKPAARVELGKWTWREEEIVADR